MSRARVTPRARILSRQTASASTARSIAASLIRRDAAMPSPQPDDARERVDDAKTVCGRPRDQEPAIVGAKVERRIGRFGLRIRARVASSRRRPSRRRPYGVRRRQRDRRCAGPRWPRPPAGGASSFIESLPAAPNVLLDGADHFQVRSGSSRIGKCTSRMNEANTVLSGAILCFWAYEPCLRGACRGAASPLCDRNQ